MVEKAITYQINSDMQFPLVEIDLDMGQSVFLQKGSMVYHTPSVTLSTHLNSKGSGFGKVIGAIGRSMVSGESMFITKAMASDGSGKLALAPSMPGEVIALELGTNQYCLNDGAFLALDGTAHYEMKRQSVGKALFAGQGGLFIMQPQGEGTLLANAFGSIKKITLQGDSITIDNSHVVAWSHELDYDVHIERNMLQSVGTGEGIVNTFTGYGDVYLQSLNLQQFSSVLSKYLPEKHI